MIDKNKYTNEFEVYCDGPKCGESEELETDHFLSAIDQIKTLGWKIVKNANDWMHLCPTCKAK